MRYRIVSNPWALLAAFRNKRASSTRNIPSRLAAWHSTSFMNIISSFLSSKFKKVHNKFNNIRTRIDQSLQPKRSRARNSILKSQDNSKAKLIRKDLDEDIRIAELERDVDFLKREFFRISGRSPPLRKSSVDTDESATGVDPSFAIPPAPPPPPHGWVSKIPLSSHVPVVTPRTQKMKLNIPKHTPKAKMNAMLDEMKSVKLKKTPSFKSPFKTNYSNLIGFHKLTSRIGIKEEICHI